MLRREGFRRLVPRAVGFGLGLAALVGFVLYGSASCRGWDPRRPFERYAPEVEQALADLDAGRAERAADVLQRYLGTGTCGDAGLGLPDSVRQLSGGSFDLSLALFELAERYGHRFGDEEVDAGEPPPEQAALRGMQIDCALIVARAIAADPSVPLELRARARYLAGNLEFLRQRYEDAVRFYDQALALTPGLPVDSGADGIGRDAAWNRAIALRRIEDKRDAGDPDASPPPDASDPPDAGNDAGNDGGQDGGNDGGSDGGGSPPDAGGDKDAGGGDDAGAPPPSPPPKPEEPAAEKQDDRMLDQLEEAPSYQEQEAKQRAAQRRGRALEDK